MTSEKKRGISPPSGPKIIDPRAAEQAGDILKHLANTVSAMKIFPLEHATVQGFVGALSEKLKGFLDTYGKMEIVVDEHSFLFGGRPVYTDAMMIKSLPFFSSRTASRSSIFIRASTARRSRISWP
jgi:hypothetical protein